MNGYKTEKYRVAMSNMITDSQGNVKPNPSPLRITYEWMAKEFYIPVRFQDGIGTIYELRIKEAGPQPDSLFEIPSLRKN